MAGSPGFLKRQKEQARQERQKEKRIAREQKKTSPRASGSEGEDPDLAGIVAGPQPPPDWLAEDAPPAAAAAAENKGPAKSQAAPAPNPQQVHRPAVSQGPPGSTRPIAAAPGVTGAKK